MAGEGEGAEGHVLPPHLLQGEGGDHRGGVEAVQEHRGRGGGGVGEQPGGGEGVEEVELERSIWLRRKWERRRGVMF